MLAARKTLAKTKQSLEQHGAATETSNERLRVGDERSPGLATPKRNRSAREGSRDADLGRAVRAYGPERAARQAEAPHELGRGRQRFVRREREAFARRQDGQAPLAAT